MNILVDGRVPSQPDSASTSWIPAGERQLRNSPRSLWPVSMDPSIDGGGQMTSARNTIVLTERWGANSVKVKEDSVKVPFFMQDRIPHVSIPEQNNEPPDFWSGTMLSLHGLHARIVKDNGFCKGVAYVWMARFVHFESMSAKKRKIVGNNVMHFTTAFIGPGDVFFPSSSCQ